MNFLLPDWSNSFDLSMNVKKLICELKTHLLLPENIHCKIKFLLFYVYYIQNE